MDKCTKMTQAKKKKLEDAGWSVSSTSDFLQLEDDAVEAEHGSAEFIVRDLTGSLPPQKCATREAAVAWCAHLMEWSPNARPIIEPVFGEISDGDKMFGPGSEFERTDGF